MFSQKPLEIRWGGVAADGLHQAKSLVFNREGHARASTGAGNYKGVNCKYLRGSTQIKIRGRVLKGLST
jgi:hypothetical protein